MIMTDMCNDLVEGEFDSHLHQVCVHLDGAAPHLQGIL